MGQDSAILKKDILRMPWVTQDPFIFCAYHKDNYPGANENMGPVTGLEGRNIGSDFMGKDGWNMYHGSKVPGFPAHPHSGFETVTIVTKGLVDHSDSLGATGRFGFGDVQWLTSGKGVQHAEMFPLLNKDANPLELFQIWFNLPRRSKKAEPHYKMLWKEDIPVVNIKDSNNKNTSINLYAGEIQGVKSLKPTPDSWAADEANHVQIWIFTMEEGAEFILPSNEEKLNRSLFFYKGDSISLNDENIDGKHYFELDSQKQLIIKNKGKEASFLFLQGRPINEPVIQHGPFVASSKNDLLETFGEYQKNQFGGWPWPSNEYVNDKEKGRFSRLPNGDEFTPGKG